MPSIPFPYGEIDARLAKQSGKAVIMDDEDSTRERITRVIDAICDWLYPRRCQKPTVILRAYTFIWFLRPYILGNPTQAELARSLGVSRASLGKVVNQMRDKFGFYVQGMRGDDARQKFAAHARKHAGDLAKARKTAYQKSIR